MYSTKNNTVLVQSVSPPDTYRLYPNKFSLQSTPEQQSTDRSGNADCKPPQPADPRAIRNADSSASYRNSASERTLKTTVRNTSFRCFFQVSTPLPICSAATLYQFFLYAVGLSVIMPNLFHPLPNISCNMTYCFSPYSE